MLFVIFILDFITLIYKNLFVTIYFREEGVREISKEIDWESERGYGGESERGVDKGSGQSEEI